MQSILEQINSIDNEISKVRKKRHKNFSDEEDEIYRKQLYELKDQKIELLSKYFSVKKFQVYKN